MAAVRSLLLVLLLLGPLPRYAVAQDRHASAATASERMERLFDRLTGGGFVLVDGENRVLAKRPRGTDQAATLAERDLVEALRDAAPSPEQVASLWEFFADEDNSDLATLPIVQALLTVTSAPLAREALWSELAGRARARKPGSSAAEASLLGLFERHREALLSRLPPLRETEGGGDEMAYLMTSSQVFGADIWQSLSHMVARNPGAVARMIERERERGRPVKWEYQAFEGMMRWKDARLVAGAPDAPQTLEARDTAGETFITIFNALHSLGDWYREQMLRGLGPVELFNAAVGGEQELYRLGTSGYREFLHPTILKGIKAAGSFEAFLDRAVPRQFGGEAAAGAARRGLVFVRIASSFGMLDSVLEQVRDRERFISDAIAGLGDPRSFEGSGAIVVDLVTSRSRSPAAEAFSRLLLDRLYQLHASEADSARRSVYGAMLSAYQTVSGDRRDREIDRAFPLDASLLHLPFDRLFKPDGRGGRVHRIFMRMHDDLDAVSTYASLRPLMASFGAITRSERNFTLFRVGSRQRAIEIYVNKPTGSGIKQGIKDIANAVRDRGVETVIGRGHTGIVTPLQADARRVLGDRLGRVAAVIVGTCGGDASVREMIGTFGYVPFVATKSTGRQVINNAILDTYMSTLLSMKPSEALMLSQVLDRALARFLKQRGDEDLREDAKLYRVNLATVLAARLFDTHVRWHATPHLSAAR